MILLPTFHICASSRLARDGSDSASSTVSVTVRISRRITVESVEFTRAEEAP